MSQLTVQPCQISVNNALPGQWYRGVPTPGAYNLAPILGVAGPQNLVGDSPPMLGQKYQLYSYSIGFGVVAESAAGAPTITAEMALLVGSEVRYVESQQLTAIESGSSGNYAIAGSWVSDLNNQIDVEARDQLTLRLGVQATMQVPTMLVAAGVQYAPAAGGGTPIPFPSTISYDVTQLPSLRRL